MPLTGKIKYKLPFCSVAVTVKGEIAEYSTLLAKRPNLRHLARLDFFLSGEKILFNEINTFPGFTKNSLYPRLVIETGIAPQSLINDMIEDALL